jgi:peroxiredoxin (alkyl hydroperoxide reductase subunit C)
MEYTLKSRKEGGLAEMEIPFVSDLNKEISLAYGCLVQDGGEIGVSYRATYIIDKNGIVRHSSINDLPVGRNPDEYLRLVKAFQYVDTHGEVCPANWQPGQKTMIPDPKKIITRKLFHRQNDCGLPQTQPFYNQTNLRENTLV